VWINNQAISDWNTFWTIVFEWDSTYATTDHSRDIDLTLEDTEVQAIAQNNRQAAFLFNPQSESSIVKILWNSNFIYSGYDLVWDKWENDTFVFRWWAYNIDPTNYLDPCYKVTQDDDKWIVSIDPAAMIWEQEYCSIEDALEDVPTDGTKTKISLLKDIEKDTSLVISWW
jgi:hypothetical protein